MSKCLIDEIEPIVNSCGYEIIDLISSREIVSIDKDGYKYKINLCNLLNGKKPHITQKNPFAIENIKNYLSIHHPDLELLSNTYVNCKTRLDFICNKHQEKGIQRKTFDGIVNDNQGCRYCGIERRGKKYQINTDVIVARCNELSLKYIDRYVQNQETWVKFSCNKHLNKGVQEISWFHLKTCARGCAYCTGRYKTTEDFVAEMATINSNIEIVGEYTGSENPVDCRCRLCGHLWSPIGRSLKNGQGCPRCTMSKGEVRIRRFLDSHKTIYISQKTFDDCVYEQKLKFDFYLPDYNTIIEYDGEQHFMPVDFANKGIEWATNSYNKNLQRDEIKNKYCKDNNIRLIRIPYYEYDNIESTLTSELSDVFLCKNL